MARTRLGEGQTKDSDFVSESELASTSGTSGADLTGIRDVGSYFTATTVEDALQELYTMINNQVRIFTKDITSAANAGQIDLGTVGTGRIQIESVVLKSNGATTSDLTNVTIKSGPSATPTLVTYIDDVLGEKANLAASGNQVDWDGKAAILEVGDKLVATLTGTGATAVDLTMIVTYRSIVAGGVLA